jgi:hypothetical protein
MKLTFLMVLAAVLHAADPFAGTWLLNPGKSHLPGTQTLRHDTIHVTAHDEHALAWSEEGSDASGRSYKTQYDLPFDGQDHEVMFPYSTGTSDTFALRRADDKTVSVVHKRDQSVLATEQRLVSHDGKTLLLVRTENSVTSVAVFDRQ